MIVFHIFASFLEVYKKPKYKTEEVDF